MRDFTDIEATLNKLVKHPEHHRQRREQFKVEYFAKVSDKIGCRKTFGQRTTPPPVPLHAATE